jgi:nucleotide-binding universal stress UspA family protein
MRIVFGTDFSEPSARAGPAAAALAARFKAEELWVVHTIDPTSAPVDPSIAEKRLEGEARRLREQTSAQVRTAVLDGLASEALQRFAEEKRAALVVVASRGSGRRPLLGVGSNSERVARFGNGPALVVRDPAPFEAWARGERPLRVLLAVDATAASKAAIDWVNDLRQAGPCDVIVGHVYYPREAARQYGIKRRLALVEADPELERLIARDLAELVGQLPGPGQVSFRPTLGLGRVGDHVLELEETEKVDLAVVGTRGKKGLERLTSVSSIVLHFGHASVACIPTGAASTAKIRELPELERVLVATDLSRFCNQAVAFGYGIVAGRGGEVCLMHVLPPRSEGVDPEEITAQLRALIPPLQGGPEIRTTTEVVRSDNPVRAILETAERMGADVICLASHGRSGIARAALGSVAEEVMRESRRPVLIVRPPSP